MTHRTNWTFDPEIYPHSLRMRTTNQSHLFHPWVALLVLLVVLSGSCAAQELNGIHFSPPMLQAARSLEITSQFGPQPPCAREPIPPYPTLGDAAVIKAWSRSVLGRKWEPPACTRWSEMGFTTLVTIAARFQYMGEAEGLLRHVGAISDLAGLRYWSTTHKQWRTFIVQACALKDSHLDQCRENFMPAEMKTGHAFYFEQMDNISGKAVYQMNIVEASASRIVFEVENVTTMRYHFVPVIRPGELQSLYFLDHESNNVWRFYSIVRTGKSVSGLIVGGESSSINRAVAFYRFLVGIPATQEPPGAR